MSMFSRRRTESRAITSLPFNVSAPFGPPTAEQALALVPMFAAIRLLADSVSSLPVDAYRKAGDTRIPVTAPSLIRQPSASGSLVDWLYRLVFSLAAWGNAYGLITERDEFGFPTMIEWLDPASVHVDESNRVRPRYYYLGREVAYEDIVHIGWVLAPGRLVALSPMAVLASTIKTGNGAQDYGASWFASGGVPPGTFQNTDKTLTQDEANTTSKRLVAAIKTGKPLVYGKDWKYEPIAIPPDQAQFVATMRMTANQVAAVYGIPPTMIGGEPGGSMTYANVEAASLDFITHTLRPWLVKIETALSALLPNAVYIKFNADALVRVDTITRHQVYEIDRRIGLRSLNEIRALEDEQPIGPEGDIYVPPPTSPPVQQRSPE